MQKIRTDIRSNPLFSAMSHGSNSRGFSNYSMNGSEYSMPYNPGGSRLSLGSTLSSSSLGGSVGRPREFDYDAINACRRTMSVEETARKMGCSKSTVYRAGQKN